MQKKEKKIGFEQKIGKCRKLKTKVEIKGDKYKNWNKLVERGKQF